MNQVSGILNRLTDIGVTLELSNDDLRIKGHRDKLTADLITELRANKADLVTLLKQSRAPDAAALSRPIRERRLQEAPLSFAQERMWFTEQLSDGSSQNNMPYALHLEGELLESALEKALNEIVRRHEVLRTTHHERDGVPYQRVHPYREQALQKLDMRGAGLAVGSPELASSLHQEAEAPFDLQTDFPLRFKLLTLAETDHVLMLTMHHIASDGWSVALLVRELSHLYNAFAGCGGSGLADIDIQYSDYTLWQRELMRDNAFDGQLEFWRSRLHGIPKVHGLPLDCPRPSIQSFASDSICFELDEGTLRALHQLSSAHQTTLFATLQSAFALLLARWSGERDIVMGTPVAGRTHVEVEPLIGFFVNTLVLRQEVRPEMTFSELLTTCTNGMQEAFSNQLIPFEMLVNELKPERSLSHSPLIQVMFTLRNNERPDLDLEGLKVEALDNRFKTLKMDLELFATEVPDGLQLLWNYSSELFSRQTIESMAASFGHLLAQILRAPDRPVSKLELLDAARTESLMRLGYTAPAHGNLTVNALVERWAQRQPEAVALKFGSEVVSYGQLNRRANKLARHIMARGVGAEDVVAICTDRSVEMIVAMLAVLKAQAAYVLLDPEYPTDRITFMLRECGAKLVLTDACQDDRIHAHAAGRVRVDGDEYADEGEQDLPAGDKRQLACVIYTSGSTGKPKGVLLQHEGIVRLVEPDGFIDFRHDDVVAQGSNCTFDLSMLEIWGALCNGARLVHVSRQDLLDGPAFCDFLVAENISVLLVTSALFKHMAALVPHAFAGLRVLMFGGEQADVTAVNRVVASGKPGKMINAYGPAENSCVSTAYEVTATIRDSVPIGRAIPGAYHYVLDAEQQMVPPGVVGELAVGGPGLAIGYHDEPELTRERFVQDAYRQDGGRIYKTGDLVRYDGSGELVFVGRVDDQVKIRGFRIEPGEVESVLASVEGVGTALVVVQERVGEKYLVAYVVRDPSVELERPIPEHLKDSLAGRLPDYLIPYAFVVLDAFPLTPNGKIDRKALPPAVFGDAQQFVAPKAGTEEQLAEIWCALLEIEKVSALANFFETGGHSLLATRMASAISAKFCREVSVRSIFEHSVLRDLAAYVDTLHADSQPDLEAAPSGSLTRPSFAQQRLWFLDQLQGRTAAGQYNLTLPLRVVGPLRLALIEQALNVILERHEALRTSFSFDGGELNARVRRDTRLKLIVENCRGQTEEQVSDRLAELAVQPFSLAEAPLLRAHALAVGDAEHVLLFSFHHIASDGWSLRVFTDELQTVYDRLLSGRPPELAPLAIQYADYAHWQRTTLTGHRLRRQLGYWEKQLANVPVSHSLPLDMPRPARPLSSGATLSAEIPDELAERLRREARRNKVTMFMLYQAAFAALLSRWSYSDDIVMGTPIAGRRHKDADPLIGFFVNTLVLRSDLSGTPTFRELLERAKATAMDAFDNQDVPFEMLVEELLPDRAVNQNPLFQIMFSTHNDVPNPVRLTGTETSMLGVQNDTIKFDLTLNVADAEQDSFTVWEYNTQLFEPQTIARLATHFLELLNAVVAQPDMPVAELDVLSGDDRLLVNGPFRSGETTDLPAVCVHELIEAQADLRPGQTAVEWQGLEMSYRTLNARANRLAHLLNAQGFEPGSLIGVCLNRTPELLVAVLAIAKAGCAYVPLDPAYPARRLRQVAGESDLAAVVTETSLVSKVPSELETVLLDDERRFDDHSDTNPSLSLSNDALIYVLYTSGSTGKPKGVEVTHRNILSLLSWAERELSPTTLRRVLLSTSLSFDPSAFEIFATFCLGGTAVLVEDGVELLRRDVDVSYVGTVPSVLRTLVDHQALPKGVAVVGCGGEALSADLVNSFVRAYPGAKLYNLYGPTECTVNATFDVHDEEVERRPSIGRPITNTEVYVLSRHCRQLPVGAVGELYIGGKAVGKGYHKQEALTQERFVDYRTDTGRKRVYRTGDLVRFLPDGRLHFLGRIDEQVKIRGFRIELGEIERTLLTHSDVDQSLVLPRDYGGDKRLVAYVVASEDAQDVPATDLYERLREYLASLLPGYMVPASFVRVPRFPVLPNGKVDKSGLPNPEEGGTASRTLPATATERRLQVVWADVLQLPVDSIGVTDSFFSLGGHSLLIIELISAIRSKMGVETTLSLIYEQPSIRQLAKAMTKGTQSREHRSRVVVPMEAGSDDEPLFLVHPIGGDVYCYAPLLAELNLGCLTFGFQRPDLAMRQDVADYGIDELARMYLREMQTLQRGGPYRLLGWSLGGLIAVRLAALLEERGQTVEYLGLIDTVDHSVNGPLLEKLGVALSEPASSSERLDGLQAEETFRQRFDAAFRVEHLLRLHEGLSADYLRKLIFSGLIASLRFEFNGKVGGLHYYGALQTRGDVPEESIDRVLSFARESAEYRGVPGDHHSIMRRPHVTELAAHIREDLRNRTTRRGGGK